MLRLKIEDLADHLATHSRPIQGRFYWFTVAVCGSGVVQGALFDATGR